MADTDSPKKRNGSLNLSDLSPEEIARRVLQTLPPRKADIASDETEREHERQIKSGEELPR